MLKQSWSQYFLSSCLLLVLLVSYRPVQAMTTVDVMIVYTQGVEDHYRGNHATRFSHLIETSNTIFRDSGVSAQLRLVHAHKVDYTDRNDSRTALTHITRASHSAFTNIETIRKQHGADMVVFYRPYNREHKSCGIAWIGGYKSGGRFTDYHKQFMYSHTSISTCGDYVTAHELGHNLGLRHSRKQDGVGGTTAYALGHGVNSQFTTIMAYQSVFNVDYWSGKVYKFSNPDLRCKGLPCGVARNQNNGADARYALNMTMPQVAEFYESVTHNKKNSGNNTGGNTGDKTLLERLEAAKKALEEANKVVTQKTSDREVAIKALRESRAALKLARNDNRASKIKLRDTLKRYKKHANLAKRSAKVADRMADAANKTKNAQRRTNLLAKHQRAVALYNKHNDSAKQLQSSLSSLTTAAQSNQAALRSALEAFKQDRSTVSTHTKALKASRIEARQAKKRVAALDRQYRRSKSGSDTASDMMLAATDIELDASMLEVVMQR